MPDIIGTISGKDILTGVMKDLPHSEAPVWSDARNVLFSDNSMQPIPGQYIISSSLGGVPIRGIKATQIDGVKTLFYGNTSSLTKLTLSGGATQVGSGYADGLWSFARWSDWMLATNGGAPLVFKGSSFAALANFTDCGQTTADFFIPIGEFMLTVSGSKINWPSRSNVEDWSPTTANSAGGLSPQDLDGPFVGGISVDQGALVFTNNSMHGVNYIGPNDYFGTFKLQTGPGLHGKLAVCLGKDKNVFGFGPNGVFVTDGNSHAFIDEDGVHDELQERLNQTYAYKSVVWHDIFSKQIVVWAPLDGATECSGGYGYNYKDQNWSPRDDARTAAEESGIFPWGILGSADGSIYAQGLAGQPVSSQDAALPLLGSGTFTMPFGQSGFGEVPLGGIGAFTE